MYRQMCVGYNCFAVAVVVVFALLFMSANHHISAEDVEIDSTAKPQPLTEACLYCICEALSGCNATAICVNGACGIFRITWGYWVDAGRPILNNGTSVDDDAFTDCVNDPFCAAGTVQSYMSKFGQDCDEDGNINCFDYAALHKMGYLNCASDQPYVYAKLINDCLETFAEQAEEGKPLEI